MSENINRILESLNPIQREAVEYTEGPLLILAGPGSGKTRIITHRIAFLLEKNISPNSILAVTFTNKAAEEMKTRVIKLSPEKGNSVWISTFHSFAAKFLRIESKKINLNPDFVIYDESDQKALLKLCIKDLNINEKKFPVGMVYDLIMRSKDNVIDAESFMIHTLTSTDNWRYTIASIYQLYQKRLIQNNALDFGDLLLKTLEVLYNNKEIREKYQKKFKYVMVDEFQDTNRCQFLLLKYLVEKHRNICVVGNDDQSIYSWRGADVHNILEFDKEYRDTKIIVLEQNYRSTKNILNCAKRVISHNNYRKEKNLWTENKNGEEICIKVFNTEFEEATFVADEIKKLCSNKYTKNRFSYKDISIFYRTNAQSRIFEEIFIKENIPYNIIGTLRFFERKEIKDIIAYLKVIINPKDTLSLKRIINVPHRNIGKNTIETIENYSKEYNLSLWETLLQADKLHLQNKTVESIQNFIKLIEYLKSKKDRISPSELTKLIIEKTGYIKTLDDGSYESEDRIANIKEFVSAISEKNDSLESFLANVALMTGIDEWDENPASSRVTLMTLHLSKGLEFPVVFITGLEEGLFPISSAFNSESELEEERRLCYVGITRAKERLYMTCAETRRIFGQIRHNIPSRFIREARNTPLEDELGQKNIMEGSVKNIQVGQRVKHQEFGEGRVIKISGENEEEMKVTVMFDNGQWKKFAYKYANLQKIN